MTAAPAAGTAPGARRPPGVEAGRRAAARGIHPYLGKPFGVDELLAVVERADAA